MDIVNMAGAAPVDMPDGPTTRQTLAYLSSLDAADLDSSVEVLAVLAVQVSRTVDRSVATGASTSVVPNMARQLRETLAEIRSLQAPALAADDPFARVQIEALGVTPSLFAPGSSTDPAPAP